MAVPWFRLTRTYKSLPNRRKRQVDYLFGHFGPIQNPEDLIHPALFVLRPGLGPSIRQRISFIRGCFQVSFEVRSYHTQSEILAFATDVLLLAKMGVAGDLVECGSFKGGGTAKLSRLADLTDCRLHVFDSFAGLPPNTEAHVASIFGARLNFPAGRFRGSLQEVRSNVSRFGRIESTRFYPGWFSDTLPRFTQGVRGAFLDVDLQRSTCECIAALYPLLTPGGVIYSHDGHVPLVVELLRSQSFWEALGPPLPEIEGLGSKKLIRIRKSMSSD